MARKKQTSADAEIHHLSTYLTRHPKGYLYDKNIIGNRIWTFNYYKLKRLVPAHPCLKQLGPPLLKAKRGFNTGRFGFVYLVRSSGYVRSGEPIYKIGKTERSPEKRIREKYREGAEIFDLREVSKLSLAEGKLIEAIKDKSQGFEKIKVTQKSIEWFGNLEKMRSFFSETCNRFLPDSNPILNIFSRRIPQKDPGKCAPEEDPIIESEETSDDDDSDFETLESSSTDPLEYNSSEPESSSDATE